MFGILRFIMIFDNFLLPNQGDLSLLMSELCSFLCFKLYSLNFAIAHAQKKNCNAYQTLS